MHVSVIKCDVWVCLCLIVWQASQLGKLSVCVYKQAWGLRLKDYFVVWCFHSLGQDAESEGWIERKREGGGSGEGEWVSQLGEIKVGLTFSTPSTPAESPPVPPLLLSPPSFLLPSPRRISELGFPRLLSEEAIMMFWNTKAFHAQTSAWFGVKERAGLPAKLSLPLSYPLSFPLSSPLSPPPPHSLTRPDSAGSSWGSRPSPPTSLSFLLFLPPLLPPHPQALGCDPSCQYCSVFDLRGRRVCVYVGVC